MTTTRKIISGKVYEMKTFAGVNVKGKILHETKHCKGAYFYVLLSSHDVENLIKAGVPYNRNVDPLKCKGIVYDFQIIKRVYSKRKKRRTHVKK